MKKKIGCPTKYKPEYCDLLIDHMSGGKSFESFAAKAGTCKDTLYKWEAKHKDFFYAKRRGEALSRDYWEEIGIKGVKGQYIAFSASTWIFIMKCRFGYRDPADQAKMQIAIQNNINKTNDKSGVATVEQYLRSLKDADRTNGEKCVGPVETKAITMGGGERVELGDVELRGLESVAEPCEARDVGSDNA